MFNREEISLFFKNLETVFCRQNLPPKRIYNVDKSGISVIQSQPKYSQRKEKNKLVLPHQQREEKILLLSVALALAGDHIPPMIIYPNLWIAAHLQHNSPNGSSYQCSQSGWINDDLFVVWLNHFQTKIKSSIGNGIVLLICDNHPSHISFRNLPVLQENHIAMLSLPPRTSNRLQPLDLTFFGLLKSALSRDDDLFMFDHAHRHITIADKPQLFNTAYVKVATMDKTLSGFKASRIVPLHQQKNIKS